MERESLEHTPTYTVEVVSLNDVKSGMVAMHGMQDDLHQRANNNIIHCSTFRLCTPSFGINVNFDSVTLGKSRCNMVL